MLEKRATEEQKYRRTGENVDDLGMVLTYRNGIRIQVLKVPPSP